MRFASRWAQQNVSNVWYLERKRDGLMI